MAGWDKDYYGTPMSDIYKSAMETKKYMEAWDIEKQQRENERAVSDILAKSGGDFDAADKMGIRQYLNPNQQMEWQKTLDLRAEKRQKEAAMATGADALFPNVNVGPTVENSEMAQQRALFRAVPSMPTEMQKPVMDKLIPIPDKKDWINVPAGGMVFNPGTGEQVLGPEKAVTTGRRTARERALDWKLQNGQVTQEEYAQQMDEISRGVGNTKVEDIFYQKSQLAEDDPQQAYLDAQLSAIQKQGGQWVEYKDPKGVKKQAWITGDPREQEAYKELVNKEVYLPKIKGVAENRIPGNKIQYIATYEYPDGRAEMKVIGTYDAELRPGIANVYATKFMDINNVQNSLEVLRNHSANVPALFNQIRKAGESIDQLATRLGNSKTRTPEENELFYFLTVANKSMNDYIKITTGAQMSEIEVPRLQAAWANPNGSWEKFIAAIDANADLFEDQKNLLKKSMGDGGYIDTDYIKSQARLNFGTRFMQRNGLNETKLRAWAEGAASKGVKVKPDAPIADIIDAYRDYRGY